MKLLTTQQELVALYGCNKYQLGDKMRNNFHIPDEYLSALARYHIFHMSGAQFTRSMWDGTLTGFPDVETTYDVIYHMCTPYKAKKAAEIRISFRKARDEFELQPIALVEIVREL